MGELLCREFIGGNLIRYAMHEILLIVRFGIMVSWDY